MAEFKHGTITILMADELLPPETAGKLDPVDVARIPKVPLGIGQVCDDAADALEKAGDKFTPPQDVKAATLRYAGVKASRIDQVIQDAEVALSVLKQASLMFKAEAYEQVRKVNDLVKAQGKHNQELLVMFERITEFFSRLRKKKLYPSPTPTSSETK